ncbi:MAG: Gfo/Idh/MocA family oxidoreductase [Bryobacteraceae bacterium]
MPILKLAFAAILSVSISFGAPLRVAIIGLEHGHVGGFLRGGALAPAGGALNRPDVQIVAIVEPRRDLFDMYAKRDHFPEEMYFTDIDSMAAKVHPDAALVFTSTYGHTAAVEQCARHGIHVMMEKPLAVSYQDALAMEKAAKTNHVHVLVDYETSWYASNTAAYEMINKSSDIGELRKVVVRDGHRGPKLIHVSPEFFHILTDPKLDGAGALYDFGCYGADLMTWLTKGETPQWVSAITEHLQPDVYPNVDDEADVTVAYKSSIAILQGSWNWPFDIKNMDVYGRTGYIKTVKHDQVEVRKPGEAEGRILAATALQAPYDDPLHYLAAVIHGDIQEDGSLSSLETNVIVAEILDAARQSAQTHRAVHLPLSE